MTVETPTPKEQGPADAGPREAARAALDQVGLLGKERQPPRALSAGEQQRVGIARAVVARPRLLIADEPTGNLDAELSLEIMQLFRRFNSVGVTMVIATHDLALASRINGRHVVLHQGEVRSDAPVVEASRGAVRSSQPSSPATWNALAALGQLSRQPVATFLTVAVIGIALALPASLQVAVQGVQQFAGGWDDIRDWTNAYCCIDMNLGRETRAFRP